MRHTEYNNEPNPKTAAYLLLLISAVFVYLSLANGAEKVTNQYRPLMVQQTATAYSQTPSIEISDDIENSTIRISDRGTLDGLCSGTILDVSREDLDMDPRTPDDVVLIYDTVRHCVGEGEDHHLSLDGEPDFPVEILDYQLVEDGNQRDGASIALVKVKTYPDAWQSFASHDRNIVPTPSSQIPINGIYTYCGFPSATYDLQTSSPDLYCSNTSLDIDALGYLMFRPLMITHGGSGGAIGIGKKVFGKLEGVPKNSLAPKAFFIPYPENITEIIYDFILR